MPRKMEWALIAAAIAAVLNYLVGLNFDSLSAEQAALIMTAINAVALLVTALRTRPVPPAAYVYVVSSLAALGTAYGAHWAQESVGNLTAVLLAVLGMLHRVQVSPVGAVDPRVLGEPSKPAAALNA